MRQHFLDDTVDQMRSLPKPMPEDEVTGLNAKHRSLADDELNDAIEAEETNLGTLDNALNGQAMSQSSASTEAQEKAIQEFETQMRKITYPMRLLCFGLERMPQQILNVTSQNIS